MRVIDLLAKQRMRNARASLAACQASAARGDWRAVLAQTRSEGELRVLPELMKIRGTAAIELGAGDVLDALGAFAGTCTLSPEMRHAIVRTLVVGGRGAAAWRLLQKAEGATHPAYVVQAERIIKCADAALRQEIREVVQRMRGTTTTVARPTPTEIAFPAPRAGGPRPGRAARLYRDPNVEDRHFDRLVADRDIFLREIAKPARAALHELRDVFVDRFGQIWREDGTVLRSVGRPVATTARADAPQVALGLSALAATRGIYHWLVDRVGMFAWLYQPDVPMPVILLGDRAPGFERETLTLAGLDHCELCVVGDVVFVERLLLPRVGFRAMAQWEQVAPVYDALRDEALYRARAEGAACPERIYISRRDARRRPMLNEAVVEEALRARGYDIVLMGQLPLWHQIAIAAQAREIVGPHGAGLSHLIFAPEGCRVTEILPIMTGTYQLRFNFARLAMLLGHDYQAWIVPQPPVGSSWELDLEAFLIFLDTEGAWPEVEDEALGDAGIA